MALQIAARKPLVTPKGEATSELLIDATCALLVERGSTDISFADIEKRAGVNSALIRYYFGNKEGLLLAVLRREAEASMKALKYLVDMDLPADKKLRTHIAGVINAFSRAPYMYRLMDHLSETGDGTSGDHIKEIYIFPMIEAYRSILAQGEREGIFRRIEPEFLYFSLVGSCYQIVYSAYSRRLLVGEDFGSGVKQRYIAHVIDGCLHGILKRDTPAEDHRSR